MVVENLRRAEAAICTTKAKYPTLTDFGFGVHEQEKLKPKQLAAEIAFLRTCEPVKTPAFGSSLLKHRAECWRKNNGLEPYVTNGGLIVAALDLGFPMRNQGDPRADFGVSKNSISQRLAEENAFNRRRRAED